MGIVRRLERTVMDVVDQLVEGALARESLGSSNSTRRVPSQDTPTSTSVKASRSCKAAVRRLSAEDIQAPEIFPRWTWAAKCSKSNFADIIVRRSAAAPLQSDWGMATCETNATPEASRKSGAVAGLSNGHNMSRTSAEEADEITHAVCNRSWSAIPSQSSENDVPQDAGLDWIGEASEEQKDAAYEKDDSASVKHLFAAVKNDATTANPDGFFRV